MILVIRISGMVNMPRNLEEILFRMRLRRKYSAVLLKPTKENMKMLGRVRNHVAYGDIEKETLEKLIELRGKYKRNPEGGKSSSGKINASKIISEIDKKSLSEQGIKPFFRLHPPRGGIESKKHFGVGKGVLGDNKREINKLLEKML